MECSRMKERFVLLNSVMVQAVLEGIKTVTRRPLNPQPELIIDAEKHSTYKYRGGLYALDMYPENSNILNKCPFGKIGDRLWVRETWAPVNLNGEIAIAYRADEKVIRLEEIRSFLDEDGFVNYGDPRLENYEFSAWADDLFSGVEGNWKPSIHMPRWASRIVLEITNIKIERVNKITETEAMAEGITFTDYGKNKFNIQHPGWLWKPSNSHEECLYTAKNAFANLWIHTYGAEAWDSNIWVWVIEFKVVEGEEQ